MYSIGWSIHGSIFQPFFHFTAHQVSQLIRNEKTDKAKLRFANNHHSKKTTLQHSFHHHYHHTILQHLYHSVATAVNASPFQLKIGTTILLGHSAGISNPSRIFKGKFLPQSKSWHSLNLTHPNLVLDVTAATHPPPEFILPPRY